METNLEKIKKILGIRIRTVVVRQRNVAILFAMIDGLSVRHRADLRARRAGRVGAVRPDIGVASRAVVDLARGSRAIDVSSSAPSIWSVYCNNLISMTKKHTLRWSNTRFWRTSFRTLCHTGRLGVSPGRQWPGLQSVWCLRLVVRRWQRCPFPFPYWAG